MLASSIALILLSCFLIYWFCNQFDTASSHLARNFPRSIKGATINAIGSSLPEMITTFLALFLYFDKEGFVFGIGTTAGSAVFNAFVIPAFVILIYSMGKKKGTIKIDKGSMNRDLMFLIIAEIAFIIPILLMLITPISSGLLLIVYGGYIFFLYKLYKKYKRKIDQDNGEETFETVGVFRSIITLNFRNIFSRIGRLNNTQSWLVIFFSLIAIGLSCHMLVKACYMFAEELGISIFFTAVFIASGATSVPDLILSIKDAQKGNVSDALSNAFGSNIFDICVGIGLPVFIFTLVKGGIEISKDVSFQLLSLHLFLIASTLIIAGVFFKLKKLDWRHSIALFSGIFIFAGFVYYIA